MDLEGAHDMKIEITDTDYTFPDPRSIPPVLLDKFLGDLEVIKTALIKVRMGRTSVKSIKP